MKHLSLTILAAAVLGLASPAARADFIVDDGAAAKPKPAPVQLSRPSVAPGASASVVSPASTVAVAPAVGQGRLVQVGAPMPGPALQGWADQIPLSLALEQIVPSGWKVETKGVDVSKTVSWKGGRSWHAIVGDLAYGNRFDARIDWVDQTVSLGPVGSLAPSVAGSPAPVRKETGGVEAAPAPFVATTPIVRPAAPVAAPVVTLSPAPPPVASWTLDPSMTLKENVEAWAKKAGWNRVVWEGADYPVVAAATFTGAFESPEGPLAKLIAAYDKSEQPLLAKLTTLDKVVTVTNRNYVPTVVNPTSPAEISPRAFPGTSDQR